MRIGIDIRSLQNESQNRGIGTYTRCLIKNLLSIDRENEYIFFVFKDQPIPSLLSKEIFKNVEVRKVLPLRRRYVSLSGQLLLPLAIREAKLDIFHSTEYILPIFSQTKKVITVHDFIHSDYKIYKKRSSFIRRMYFWLRDETLRHAHKIIAISEYTKKKIMELVGIKEAKIKVIYEAADDVFRPQDDNELFSILRKKYSIDSDFLLYVGTIEHHKNIHNLIKAFSQIKFKDVGLVLVGTKVKNDMGYFTFINMLIKQLGLKNRVYILDCVPQEDLVDIYNMAKIVISVSFYEGFGLPVLEGMSCGRSVIGSNNSSIKEIVDSCGILIDPYNIDEITSAIDNLLSDQDLRDTLSGIGLKRSREFSWEKVARETISLYKDLLR